MQQLTQYACELEAMNVAAVDPSKVRTLTVDALSAVLNHDLLQELAECRLALERAHMSARGWLPAMSSPYSTSFHTRDLRHRSLSWRDFGQERNDVCDYLVFEVMEPAEEILASARRDIRSFLSDPTDSSNHREALTTAYNAMCAVDRALRDRSDESADESEDDDKI